MGIRLGGLLMCVVLLNQSAAASNFCLSGGIEHEYSCESKSGNTVHAGRVFGLQLVINDPVQAAHIIAALPYPLLYRTATVDGSHLVYVGGFNDISQAQDALQALLSNPPVSVGKQKPLLVEYQPTATIPRIRGVAPRETATATPLVLHNDAHLYTIEMLALPDPATVETFLGRHPEIELLCSQSSGTVKVYYGLFDDVEEATAHLRAKPLFSYLGAFVTEQGTIDIKPCADVLEASLS